GGGSVAGAGFGAVRGRDAGCAGDLEYGERGGAGWFGVGAVSVAAGAGGDAYGAGCGGGVPVAVAEGPAACGGPFGRGALSVVGGNGASAGSALVASEGQGFGAGAAPVPGRAAGDVFAGG